MAKLSSSASQIQGHEAENSKSPLQKTSKVQETANNNKKNMAGINTACRGRAAAADKQLNCGHEWKTKYTKYSLDQQEEEEKQEENK